MATPPAARHVRVRHVLLTACLVLAPILLATGNLFSLNIDFDDRAAVIGAATAEPLRWQAQQLVTMLGFMLLVPAVIAAGELVRRRSPALALTAVALLGAGAMVIVGAVLHEWTLAAATGVDEAAMAQYETQIDELGSIAVLFPFFFASLVGVLFLAAGLWRSKATPLWVPILLVISMAVVFFADRGVVSTLGDIGLGVAFLGIAWSYWKSREVPQVAVRSDAEAKPPVTTTEG